MRRNRRNSHFRTAITCSKTAQDSFAIDRHFSLIERLLGDFCRLWAPGGIVLRKGDTENKFGLLELNALTSLGVTPGHAAKMPDVIVHYTAKNWLLLIEAVTSAGPIDGKRRKELKSLFAGCTAGLVFVTAFETRRSMQTFLAQLTWESEVWIAEEPDHMIHFNGARFLGPYPDATPEGTGVGSPA
jgi:hypothetical protein